MSGNYSYLNEDMYENMKEEMEEKKMEKNGYERDEYDYEQPYFEPASIEEELIIQLNKTLAVEEIKREEIE